jgi:hypothetical protein
MAAASVPTSGDGLRDRSPNASQWLVVMLAAVVLAIDRQIKALENPWLQA